MLRGMMLLYVSPEPTCFDGMQQSEEGWCDSLAGWADQRPYHWPLLHNGSVTGQVYLQLQQQRVWPAPQAIMGERKNLLFTSMMEPQLIMKPMLEPGWAGGQMDGQRGTHTMASTKS